MNSSLVSSFQLLSVHTPESRLTCCQKIMHVENPVQTTEDLPIPTYTILVSHKYEASDVSRSVKRQRNYLQVSLSCRDEGQGGVQPLSTSRSLNGAGRNSARGELPVLEMLMTLVTDQLP